MLIAKLARELKGYGKSFISENHSHCPGLCFSVSVGFAEVKKDIPLEKMLSLAESSRTVFYEFKTEESLKDTSK